jgi:hypothetical protein
MIRAENKKELAKVRAEADAIEVLSKANAWSEK